MEDDVPFAFPLRYGPIGSARGIREPVHVANQLMVYGLCCSIPEP
ncbi:hypothetical protein Godav_026034 [Gossypium davidsonii]|uniref:Uncharacterized protein n=1 Tax=Gossypium davidsonii TaxID=34287 RepID=A0A7J8TDA4_GOSDV|nr:hypothetical protein [Gossypium davidsonii]